MAMRSVDVLIVGAGPIGLELAVSLKAMGVDYEHVDAGQIAQTITWYPRQVRFFSSPERIAIAGVPLQTADQSKATREEYLAYLRSVVQQFQLNIRTYTRVTAIDGRVNDFTITLQHGDDTEQVQTRHIVLAIGDMHGPRYLHIPGEDLPHVSHYFDEPHTYFHQKLLIVGGKNSAAEAALRCHRAGAKVAISYRKPGFDERSIKYWLLPELKSLITQGHIAFYPSTAPRQITRTHVTLASTAGEPRDDAIKTEATEKTWRVEANMVLLLTGYVMDSSLLAQAGVELVGENQAPGFDPQTMQTNVPGLFVAGTAAAGSQVKFRLFIENCHHHVTRIVHAITGKQPPAGLVNDIDTNIVLPES